MSRKLFILLLCLAFSSNSIASKKSASDLNAGDKRANDIVTNDNIANESEAKKITSLKNKLENAIVKLEKTNRRNWAYQVSRYEKEEGDVTSSFEVYSPQKAKALRWQLNEINGELPTKKQQTQFQERKLAELEKREQGSNHSVELRELINLESIKQVTEDQQYFYADFDVYLKKLGEDSKGKITGRLEYNKQDSFIERITITNNGEFSPLFSASIDEFSLTFTFIHINNSVLPKQHDMQMKGSFAFFTEIDEISTDVYSNYVK